MKRSQCLMIVLLTICMVWSVSAQVNFGVLGGLNLANINIDPEPVEGFEVDNFTGFGIGGVVTFKIGSFIAIQLEPMYLLKGFKEEEMGIFVREAKLAYIEIPLMVKYVFGSGGVRPYIMTGPTLGFNLSAKLKTTGVLLTEEEDFKDHVKSMDFGVGFGAGLSFPMGKLTFFVEGRYGLGLANILENDELEDVEIKTKGIQVFTGISLPMGGN